MKTRLILSIILLIFGTQSFQLSAGIPESTLTGFSSKEFRISLLVNSEEFSETFTIFEFDTKFIVNISAEPIHKDNSTDFNIRSIIKPEKEVYEPDIDVIINDRKESVSEKTLE